MRHNYVNLDVGSGGADGSEAVHPKPLLTGFQAICDLPPISSAERNGSCLGQGEASQHRGVFPAKLLLLLLLLP